MKIFCNTNALLKQLQEFHVEAIKKMETMVETFSYNVAVQAIDNTPYGNHIAYAKFYNNWERLKWFQPIAGSAKGGWGIYIDKYDKVLVPLRADSADATNTKAFAKQDIQSYKLGDTVHIVNSVPYVATQGFTQPNFGSLDGGYSPQAPRGIMAPTVESILGIYQLQLNEYYKAT